MPQSKLQRPPEVAIVKTTAIVILAETTRAATTMATAEVIAETIAETMSRNSKRRGEKIKKIENEPTTLKEAARVINLSQISSHAPKNVLNSIDWSFAAKNVKSCMISFIKQAAKFARNLMSNQHNAAIMNETTDVSTN